MGTGCVSCHLTPDGVLAARSSTATASAPHAVIRDGRLDSDAACAGCHEFAFPKGKQPQGAMQSTVSEHRESPGRDTSCAACHMPQQGRRRSHRFASSRDAGRVRAAVSVSATRTSATAVRITLVSNVRGHRFPTGDLFRRIEVLIEAVAPSEVLVASRVRYLGRHFPLMALRPGGPKHRTRGPDDRLAYTPVVLDFELSEALGLPLRYRVSYQRVAHPRSPVESHHVLDGEVVLASGVLPPSPAAAAQQTSVTPQRRPW